MTDYCGNLIYKDSTLAFILMPEGRFVRHSEQSEESIQFEYFIKDHLGNTRLVVSHSGKILEEDNYYPFGMNITTLSKSTAEPENRYKYNGKELVSDFGLEWYDYGARHYDAQIGRWHVVDPMEEKYYSHSPYHFSGNNPILFLDDNGMNYGDYFDINGDFLYNDGKDDGIIYVEKEIQGFIETVDFRDANLTFDALSNIATFFYEKSGYKPNELVNSKIRIMPEREKKSDIYGNKYIVINEFASTGYSVDYGYPKDMFGISINKLAFTNEDGIYNSFDFINLYRHERGQHGADILSNRSHTPSGIDWDWEKDATRFQQSDPTWNKTSKGFKQTIYNAYGHYLYINNKNDQEYYYGRYGIKLNFE